jgi:hypothetical protein
MTDSTNTVVMPSKPAVLWRAGGFVYIEKSENPRRCCVRGIPIGKEVWMPGDGPVGEPANENIKGGRYPLQEEFKAKRLGKTDEESDVLWSTAKWFASHHDIANRPYKACSYGIGQAVKVGELGGFVDPEEHRQWDRPIQLGTKSRLIHYTNSAVSTRHITARTLIT